MNIWYLDNDNLSNIYPIIRDSWTIYSNNIFVKLMDKSAFLYNVSGIPKEIIPFWEAESLERGNKFYINLKFKDNIYSLRIERENYKYMRIRMFWDKSLSKVISDRYPLQHECLVKREHVDNFPSMRFIKQDKYNYDLEFIYSHDTEEISQDEYNEIIIKEVGTKDLNGISHERDPRYRRIAMEHHGTSCLVCGFNFEDTYGDIGEGFIEIHNTKPLFINGQEIEVNPYTDLVPLCSNCHSIVHRDKENILTLDELKAKIFTTLEKGD